MMMTMKMITITTSRAVITNPLNRPSLMLRQWSTRMHCFDQCWMDGGRQWREQAVTVWGVPAAQPRLHKSFFHSRLRMPLPLSPPAISCKIHACVYFCTCVCVREITSAVVIIITTTIIIIVIVTLHLRHPHCMYVPSPTPPPHHFLNGHPVLHLINYASQAQI